VRKDTEMYKVMKKDKEYTEVVRKHLDRTKMNTIDIEKRKVTKKHKKNHKVNSFIMNRKPSIKVIQLYKKLFLSPLLQRK